MADENIFQNQVDFKQTLNEVLENNDVMEDSEKDFSYDSMQCKENNEENNSNSEILETTCNEKMEEKVSENLNADKIVKINEIGTNDDQHLKCDENIICEQTEFDQKLITNQVVNTIDQKLSDDTKILDNSYSINTLQEDNSEVLINIHTEEAAKDFIEQKETVCEQELDDIKILESSHAVNRSIENNSENNFVNENVQNNHYEQKLNNVELLEGNHSEKITESFDKEKLDDNVELLENTVTVNIEHSSEISKDLNEQKFVEVMEMDEDKTEANQDIKFVIDSSERKHKEWSSDSEEDSESSSGSSDFTVESSDEDGSNVSSIESEKVFAVQKNLKSYPKTKGELDLEDLPHISDLQISVNEEELEEVGIISSIVEELVIIQSHRDRPTLDLDSVLFLEGNKPLGHIFDVFGPVIQPSYAVRFNSNQDILDKGIKKELSVYCAPSHLDITKFVFTESLRNIKGSDASWEDNNEPPVQCLEYSDDEKERESKCKRKNKINKEYHLPNSFKKFTEKSQRMTYAPNNQNQHQGISFVPQTSLPPFASKQPLQHTFGKLPQFPMRPQISYLQSNVKQFIPPITSPPPAHLPLPHSRFLQPSSVISPVHNFQTAFNNTAFNSFANSHLPLQSNVNSSNGKNVVCPFPTSLPSSQSNINSQVNNNNNNTVSSFPTSSPPVQPNFNAPNNSSAYCPFSIPPPPPLPLPQSNICRPVLPSFSGNTNITFGPYLPPPRIGAPSVPPFPMGENHQKPSNASYYSSSSVKYLPPFQ